MHKKWPYLLDFLRKNRRLVVGTFFAGLFANIFTVLIPVSIGKYFNLVFEFDSKKSAILDIFPAFFWDTVPHFIMFFLTLIFARILFGFFERYWTGILGEKLVYKLRGELFEHQLYMEMREYDEKGIGKYLLRYSGDLRGVQNYLSKGILQFASDFLLLVIASIALLWIDFWLFAILITFLVTTLYFISILNRKLYAVSERHRGAKSGLISFVNTRLRGILTIRAFNKQKSEYRKFTQKSRRIYQRGTRYQLLFALVQVAVPSLLYLMLAIVLVYVYLQNLGVGTQINGGALLTSVLILLTMMPVLRRILRVTIKWKLGNLSMTKLMNTFHKAQEHNANLPSLQLREGGLQVRNLDFRYNEANPVFSGLSMELPARQVAWVQGRLGSGKSTLLKLLMGIYEPDAGEILLDGQSYATGNPTSIRQCMTVVSSEIPIYGNNVFEATSRKHRKSSRRVVQRMLDRIQAHLPPRQRLSLDEAIGDLGQSLSLGQIKILTYVRAFTSNKSIILIDEPFSGLDQRTSEIIARMLRKMKHKATIIIFSKSSVEALGDLANILCIDAVLELSSKGEEGLEETIVEEKDVEIGQTLTLEQVSVSDSRGREVFGDLSLEIPGGKITLIIAAQRKQRTFLRRVLTGRSYTKAGTFLLGSKEFDEEDRDFGREMVAYGGPNVSLSGDTVLDAVVKSRDPLMREEAERMILLLQNQLPVSDRLLPDDEMPGNDALEEIQRLILSMAKAIVSRKPVLVLEQPFDLLDPVTELVLCRLLRREKTNRTVVIIAKSNPLIEPDIQLILEPDKVVQLDDLLDDGKSPASAG